MVDFIPLFYIFSIQEIFSQKGSIEPIPCRDRVCREAMRPFFRRIFECKRDKMQPKNILRHNRKLHQGTHFLKLTKKQVCITLSTKFRKHVLRAKSKLHIMTDIRSLKTLSISGPWWTEDSNFLALWEVGVVPPPYLDQMLRSSSP